MAMESWPSTGLPVLVEEGRRVNLGGSAWARQAQTRLVQSLIDKRLFLQRQLQNDETFT